MKSSHLKSTNEIPAYKNTVLYAFFSFVVIGCSFLTAVLPFKTAPSPPKAYLWQVPRGGCSGQVTCGPVAQDHAAPQAQI